MVKMHSGRDVWRNGFTVNAADLLQMVRWAAGWSDETFKQVLCIIAKRTRGERTNTVTVEKVLGMMSDAGLLTTKD